MSLQVPPFFPPDTNFDKLVNKDFQPIAADTDADAYVTRIVGLFTNAAKTGPGLNSVLALYQPFYECFVDQNRRWTNSTDLLEFQLKAIYKNAKDFGLYQHVFE
ncbi:hypothetical protein Ab1vBOLIVR5_gp08 [Agrobacterium phage OLIVR5]|uniref:Uncharacterized protein n=1 Tax=Agrobacterium phage OLIVR5 TaxID=2723773 RepID=A0A858MSD6_9CAUD|nr:hypothetical protein KNU99_gp008 [Agrobacterium phage OLIVR5]QIW87656.1 hypothetical protein Ab1vBOLIVR5_gp08 [Agrobacterium phage OLIVR5]QIW87915.1 hypothetical protein Ab1vBOLIVR6_gp08 [Agrobacterium phage OLIVR6]